MHNGTVVVQFVSSQCILGVMTTKRYGFTRQVTGATHYYAPRLIVYPEINHMNFPTEKRYKTIRHCCFLHTLYKRIGYVIIPKHIFQAVKV